MFVKIHSDDIRSGRISTGDTLDVEFTLFELKKALREAKNTSPGRDIICYIMIKNLSELFNKVWREGKLPTSWKHGVLFQ